MQTERRKHRRYYIKDKAFTVLYPDPVKLVPIVDIGMGGLSIYMNDGTELLNESSKLEIMVADCSFYMDNLGFEIVSDFRPFPDHSASLIDGRRYSIKFHNLSNGQKASLKHFIRTYSDGGILLQAMQKVNKFLRPSRAGKYFNKSCDTRIWQGLHHPST